MKALTIYIEITLCLWKLTIKSSISQHLILDMKGPTLTVLLSCLWTIEANLYQKAAQFCQHNGLDRINLVHTSESKEAEYMMKQVTRQMLMSNRRLRMLISNFDFNMDTVVVLTTANDRLTTQFDMALTLIGSHKIRRSLLLVDGVSDAPMREKVEDHLRQFYAGQNAWFYLFFPNSTIIRQVISLTNSTQGVLIQDLLLNKRGQIIEKYNLEGLHLYSTALNWAPYFTLENCNEKGRNCQLEGYLSDLMTAMGQTLNFTWTSHKPIDGSWGVRPLSGPFNFSGVWGGAMGGVLQSQYHLSLSQWVWNIERYGLLDFVVSCTKRMALVLTPQPPPVDMGLFFRPFRDEAWTLVGFSICLIFITLIIPFATISFYEETNAKTITTLTAWGFFVLINAYYGGAMTMFFSSELRIPFNGIEDVIQAYPDWKLKMQIGNDVYFQYKALQGDPLYVAFWQRVIEEPHDTVFNTIQEGMDLLREERAVVHTSLGMLKGFIKARPFRSQNVKVFGYGNPEFANIILTLNSPLKPILQKAINQLTEAGTNDFLLQKWEGQLVPTSDMSNAMILGAGQMIFMFGLLVFIMLICLVILGCEYSVSNMKARLLNKGLFTPEKA